MITSRASTPPSLEFNRAIGTKIAIDGHRNCIRIRSRQVKEALFLFLMKNGIDFAYRRKWVHGSNLTSN